MLSCHQLEVAAAKKARRIAVIIIVIEGIALLDWSILNSIRGEFKDVKWVISDIAGEWNCGESEYEWNEFFTKT